MSVRNSNIRNSHFRKTYKTVISGKALPKQSPTVTLTPTLTVSVPEVTVPELTVPEVTIPEVAGHRIRKG